ncbi:MAG: GDSL-type esterase/lipase family protein [Verrucomicrobiota bacterium]
MFKRSCLAVSCHLVCASILTFILPLLPAQAQADPPVVTIMPLGDSITVGSGGTANMGGYRGTLFTLLTDAGYTPDFIGTQTNNSSLITDQNHQGQGGWRIDQIDANIETWFNSVADPDVILLHIGTNDFGQSYNISTAAARLDALILKMATLRPNAQIIVTNLMERGEPHNANIVSMFNPQVPGIVTAHANAGRKVTFLNMRAAVPLSDMPDSLHPNDAGYVKMANAWLSAIQAVVAPGGVTYPPYVQTVRSPQSRDSVTIRYSKPVADNAADPANYSISGLTVTAASLSVDKREVTLSTALQTVGTTYTITINNIVDRQTVPLPLPPNTTTTFSPPLPRGYAVNVPESAGYTLVQSIDLPQQAAYGAVAPPYSVDNRALIAGYDRVAYYLELENTDGTFSYAWVSMNAFTNDIYKLGLPTLASGAIFEQGVTNINVASNVPGVLQGNAMAGNIEFWPTNYTEGANNGIGGSSTAGTGFDFDDTRSTTGTFGSMQVHNTTDKKTIFAINDWGNAATTPPILEIGIGNQPTGNPDWTHSESGSLYTSRKLYVLVRASMDSVAPTIVAATASNGRARVYVDFSEPVLPQTVLRSSFALSHGVTVLAVELSSNGRQAVLTTTPMPVGQTLVLTVNDIRDSSPSANRIAANTTVNVALPAVPAEITSRVGAAANNYQLVYTIDLPQVGNLNALGSKAYSWDDSAATQPFSRVAYYLETQKPGAAAQYVWVSMKPFSLDRRKLGVPTLASGASHQALVEDMEVMSNVAGVVTGSGITTGNIEFWPTDYSVANGVTIPNADATKYDFGDTRSGTGSYGSMQLHNHGASQTLFAVNHWGADGNTLDVGIGNNTAAIPDWTGVANAGTYYKRRLHVLVLPATPALPTEVAANVPEAQGYQLLYSLNIPSAGNMTAPAYTVNNSAQVGPFSRVAYYMQLQTGSNTPEFVWASMDAFTTDATRLGVPTATSGAIHQRIVNNMNVVSNKSGIVNGTGITTGNIEFWPHSYSAPNAINIPNTTSTTTYDFGDTRSSSGGHGSMQIHNHGASQTLFAISNWATAGNLVNKFGLGIGNGPTPTSPDWTFAANSDTYSNRILHVFVLPGDPDFTGPVVMHATGAASLDKVAITFNETVDATDVVAGNFSIPGLTVANAQLLPGQREVILTTSAQTAGTAYTVAISNVKDISTRGNGVAAGTTVSFTAYQVPALISGIPQAAGYELVYRVAIPTARPQWNLNAIPYSVDEPKFRSMQFDRVAYVLELDGSWIFTSFDRHTSTFSKIGVPTLNVTSTPFQMNVSNLTVATNVATGITTGDFATGGNIEFWGNNFNQANALSVPNASATLYDWGDRMDSTGGYGSLQVHNHAEQQVLFAYSNWGSTAGSTSDIGIGTRSTSHPDWTTSANSNTYTVRNLYVLARAGGTPFGDAPVILVSPTSRTVNPGTSTTFGVTLQSTTVGTTYQWRRNLVPIPGATLPWLELTGITGEQSGDYDVVVTGENLVSAFSAAAALTVTNSAPTFSGYQFSTPMNTAALIPAGELLGNANDADGDVLTVNSAGPASAQGGSAAVTAGNVTYVPANGHVGADSFTAVIQDGRGGSVNGTVNVTVIGTTLPSENGATIGRRADGKIDLAFKGTAGAQYLIRRSLTLAPGSWSTVATVTAGDDGVIPFVDPTPPAGRAFYRIETPPAM